MPVRSSDVSTTCPSPVRSRCQQRAEDAGQRRDRGDVVADAAAELRLRLVGRHGQRRQTRAGPERADVVAGPPRLGPVAAVPGDRRVDRAAGARPAPASGPRPRRSTASGRRFVMNTSAVASSRCIASRPSSVSRSRTTDRLPRLSRSNGGLGRSPRPPAVTASIRRIGSPAGASTLMTSAPQSAMIPAGCRPGHPHAELDDTNSFEHRLSLATLAGVRHRA